MPTHDSQIVRQLPLADLRRGGVATGARPVRQLSVADMKELLRVGSSTIVIADVGRPLLWYEGDERFEIWKQELKGRTVPPEAQRFRLEDFPGERCYVATEWLHPSGEITAVFQMFH